MRERLHILLCKPTKGPAFDPRPRANICNRVFSLAAASEVVAGFVGVLAAQTDFKDAIDTKGFVAEAFNCV